MVFLGGLKYDVVVCILVVCYFDSKNWWWRPKEITAIHIIMTRNFCLARAPIISPDFPVRTGRKF
jgi:hypothetical protein